MTAQAILCRFLRRTKKIPALLDPARTCPRCAAPAFQVEVTAAQYDDWRPIAKAWFGCGSSERRGATAVFTESGRCVRAQSETRACVGV